MARPKNPDLERLWQHRLRRKLASGLPVAAFCSREGVSVAGYSYWKRRLDAVSSPRQPALFVPVRVLDEPHEVSSVASGVELELPHQVRLRLDAPPEPEWLGRVVAILAGLHDREATP
jgi:hypothetical protein